MSFLSARLGCDTAREKKRDLAAKTRECRSSVKYLGPRSGDPGAEAECMRGRTEQ